jgi:hypothetical protein
MQEQRINWSDKLFILMMQFGDIIQVAIRWGFLAGIAWMASQSIDSVVTHLGGQNTKLEFIGVFELLSSRYVWVGVCVVTGGAWRFERSSHHKTRENMQDLINKLQLQLDIERNGTEKNRIQPRVKQEAHDE